MSSRPRARSISCPFILVHYSSMYLCNAIEHSLSSFYPAYKHFTQMALIDGSKLSQSPKRPHNFGMIPSLMSSSFRIAQICCTWRAIAMSFPVSASHM